MLIGLTGGIASGKSSVSAMIKEMGYPIIDADLIARKVVEPGERAFIEIVKHFGTDILDEIGQIARKKLGAIVFNDEKERNVLNEIVHPAVRERMSQEKAQYLKEGHTTIVFDIPLLYESNLFHLVDKVLLVYVNANVQLKRLQERDQAGELDAKQRIQSQMSLSGKQDRADAVIDNNGTLEYTRKQLEDIFEQWELQPSR
jgi:dephospho-CoA kinase